MGRKNRGEIRVSSGTLRGRRLRYPPGRTVRPTMERTRSSIFESLGDAVTEAVFVDMFAGAGAVGIEAYSRGAAHVHFVERDRDALRHLAANLTACGLPEGAFSIYRGDALRLLRDGAFCGVRPHIVFVDPPYEFVDLPLLLELLTHIEYPPDAVVVLERATDDVVETPGWHIDREKHFGQTTVTFLTPSERIRR